MIRLPDDWTGWNAEKKCAFEPFDTEYDIVFHLYGEQKMPVFWGIRQIKARKHIFVTSPQYSVAPFQRSIERLRSSVLLVSPFDPQNVESAIQVEANKYPKNAKIAFNLTGGTKLMYAGALAASKDVNGVPFYFNIENHSIVCLNGFSARPMIDLDTILPFIQLNGRDLKITNDGALKKLSAGDDEQCRLLTNELWALRSPVAEHYKALTAFQPKRWNGKCAVKFKPFSYTGKVAGKPFSARLDKNGAAIVELNGKIFRFVRFESLAGYLTGGWFEEYVYKQILPLQDKGLIHDLRINFEVSFKNKGEGSSHGDSVWRDFYHHS